MNALYPWFEPRTAPLHPGDIDRLLEGSAGSSARRAEDRDIEGKDELGSSLRAAFEELRAEGTFRALCEPRFLAIWLPDSGHEINLQSVRRLNPPGVAAEFQQVYLENLDPDFREGVLAEADAEAPLVK